MATSADKLQTAKAQVSYLEYELSDEVMAKKKAMSDELCQLIDNDTYGGVMDLTGTGLYVECDYYDTYTEIVVDNYRMPIVEVCANPDGGSFVVDEEGDEHYFIEHLTTEEVEYILNEVRAFVHEDNETAELVEQMEEDELLND